MNLPLRIEFLFKLFCKKTEPTSDGYAFHKKPETISESDALMIRSTNKKVFMKLEDSDEIMELIRANQGRDALDSKASPSE